MDDPLEILKRLDAIESSQSSAEDLLRKLDEVEGKPTQGPIVYIANNGGTVSRGDRGLSYSDQAYSTNDPEQIQKIMSGETAGNVSRSSFDQGVIRQNPTATRAAAFMKGVPFVGSYTDDVIGAAYGDKAASAVRASQGALSREKPGQNIALQTAGTVAGSVPMAMMAPQIAAAAPSTRGGQALMGAGVGVAGGALEGAVYQYGEDGNALRGGLTGAMIGGPLGAAAPFANHALKSLMEWGAGTDVGKIARELGIAESAAVVVRNAFRAGDHESARNALKKAGENGMLADAGQAARELLDATAASGGQAGTIAREAVDSRAREASQNMQAALDRSLGAPIGQGSASRTIRDGTKGERKNLYDQAYSSPIDYSDRTGVFIESLIPRIPKSAVDAANDLMRVQGRESKQILADVSEDGTVNFFRLPDVEQLHYVLQALSDTVEGAKSQFGRNTTKSTSYSKLRQQLSNAVKRAVPAFSEAQDVAADTIAREQFMDAGWKLLSPGTRMDDVQESLKNATKAERRAMATGVRGHIEEALANVKGTITDPDTDIRESMKIVKDLSSRASRMKLTSLLGPKRAKVLLEAIDKETVALELRAAIATNSKTAIRQSIQEGVKEQTAPGILGVLSQGKPVDASKRLVQALTGNTPEAQQLREMKIFEEIARLLTGVRGKGAQKALATVNKAIEGQKLTEAAASQVANVVVAASALTANRKLNQQLQP